MYDTDGSLPETKVPNNKPLKLKSNIFNSKFFTFVAVFSLIGVITLATSLASSVPPEPAATPYVRLFSELNNPGEARNANTDQQVAELATWYEHIHGEASNPNSFSLGSNTLRDGKTFAQRVSEAGMMASQYRNGSYVSQASGINNPLFYEGRSLEQQAPLAINTYWPGNYRTNGGNNNSDQARLTQFVNASASTISVRAVTDRPGGTANTWPFFATKDTNGNGYSDSTADYISWIRVGDEIMRVNGAPSLNNGVVTLSVTRGYFGTTATSHAASDRVLTPTYIGNKNSAPSDAGLSGIPTRNQADKAIRYGIRIWEPAGYNWIADQIKETFGANLSGYNTIHLDVSSCTQYNNAAYDGNTVFNWDQANNSKIDLNQWGVYQKQKVDGLRAALPGVMMNGNNFAGKNDTCNETLLSTAYDGALLEHWMKTEKSWIDFASTMEQNFKIQDNNWPAIYWVRWNYDFNGNVNQYKRFAYGSLLLALNPSADRYQYGGLWGAGQPDNLMFYDWGQPIGDPNSLADVQVENNLYRRDFERGFVLVNSSNSEKTYSLDGNYFSLDVDGNPTLINGSVTVGANDAVFLMNEDGTSPPPPPPPAPTPEPVVVDVPTNLQTAAGDSTVVLSWQDQNDEPVDFVISYRQPGDDTWTWPGSTNDTTFEVDGLTNGAAYEFRVRARFVDDQGTRYVSDDAGPITASPVAPPEPEPITLSAPTNVTADAGDEEITLSWEDSNTLDVDFRPSYRAPDETSWTWPGKTTGTSYTFTGLENDVSYELRVLTRHTTDDGERVVSSFSEVVLSTPVLPIDETPPSTPDNFRVTSSRNFSAILGWNQSADNSEDALKYEVKMTNNNGFNRSYVTNETSLNLWNLRANTPYTAQVVSIDNNGNVSEPTSIEFRTKRWCWFRICF